jgi:hypothetical protein
MLFCLLSSLKVHFSMKKFNKEGEVITSASVEIHEASKTFTKDPLEGILSDGLPHLYPTLTLVKSMQPCVGKFLTSKCSIFLSCKNFELSY